jgi:hypothetical protein
VCREMLVAPPPGWTPEQVEKFKAEWERAFAAGEFDAPPKLIPPRPLLTPEAARELLRECVTIVKPGEVLVIRTPDDWTAMQVEDCQESIDEGLKYRQLDVAVLFLPGEEFAVAARGSAAGDPEAAR